MTSASDISLFIDPFSYHFLNDRLFDRSVERFNGDHTKPTIRPPIAAIKQFRQSDLGRPMQFSAAC
jgi:hypothetical protein